MRLKLPSRPREIGGLSALLLPSALFVAFFFILPVVLVLALSVTDPRPGFGNYELLIGNPALARIFGTTLRITLITVVVATVVGYMIAYRMLHAGPREFRFIFFCLLIPLWTPILVRAFAWVALLQTNGIINGTLINLGLLDSPVRMVRNEFGVLVGMVHVMIPYAAFPIYSAMKGLDPRVMQAARSLGARPWAAFWKIFFPMTLPGVGTATILVFIISVGFYVTPIILGGGTVVMIAEYISVQITETVRWGLGSMLATVLLAIVLLVVTVFRRMTVLRQGSA
jgi:ABC-type spermidine/putrescine transport system, permease component I